MEKNESRATIVITLSYMTTNKNKNMNVVMPPIWKLKTSK